MPPPPYFMKKLLPYIASAVIAFCALISPVGEFKIPPPDSSHWILVTILVVFAGVLLLFLKANLFIKVFSALALLNCFLSQFCFASLLAYYSVVGCCYFYILCSRIENYKPVFITLKSLVAVSVFFIIMQDLGKDGLMNANRHMECFGIMGQTMQMGSFAIILTAPLLAGTRFPFNLGYLLFPAFVGIMGPSYWTFAALAAGCLLFLFFYDKYITSLLSIMVFSVFFALAFSKFVENFSAANGRWLVWVKSVKMSVDHLWFGYGIGTYKILFPSLSKMEVIPWRNAHNTWVQIFFEMGTTGLLAFLAYAVWLFRRVYKAGFIIGVAGLAMVFVDSLAHFPDRMIGCVPIMIFFFAFCERQGDTYGQAWNS